MPHRPPADADDAASLASARRVVTAVFFAFAIGFGLWAGAIPALMRQAGMGVADLGGALTLHAAAYILAMTLGGQTARRVAPRRMIRAALPLHAGAFWLLFGAASPLGLTLALVAVGLTGGLLDLAMNAEGTAVERAIGRPVLTRMHAFASSGFALGGIGGSVLANAYGPGACALLVGVVIAPTLLAVTRLPIRTPEAAPAAPAGGRRWHPGSAVLLLGIVLGLSIGAEMAAQMWSANFLERQAEELAAFAGLGAAFFAGCQALVRWFGDRLRGHYGDHRLIARSLGIAALGFALVAWSPAFSVSLIGFALVGLGTGCIVPCCFALVARAAPAQAAANLGVASFVAGLIRMPTPLMLGLVSSAYSDETAFAGLAVALLCGLWLVGRQQPAAAAAGSPAA